MDIQQDDAAMLPSGDFDKLDKRQKEDFHAMQERATAFLLQQSNDFQRLHPGLRIEWRFQMEVYTTVGSKTQTVRYVGNAY